MKDKKKMAIIMLLFFVLISIGLIPQDAIGIKAKMKDQGKMLWTGTLEMTPAYPLFEVVSHNEPKSVTLRGVPTSKKYTITIQSNFPTTNTGKRKVYFDMTSPQGDISGYGKVFHVQVELDAKPGTHRKLEVQGSPSGGKYYYTFNERQGTWLLPAGLQEDTFTLTLYTLEPKTLEDSYKYDNLCITMHMDSTSDRSIKKTYQLALTTVTIKSK